MRVRPHSPETEQAVLAGCLAEPALLSKVQRILCCQDFYLEKHRLIFAAMERLQGEASPIDLRTVQADLEGRGQLDRVGGVAFLATMDMELPDISRLKDYACIVKDRAVRCRILDGSDRLQALAVDCGQEPRKVADQTSSLAALAADLSPSSHLVSLGEAAADALMEIEDGNLRPEAGLSTGFPELDLLLGGFRKGRQVILGGRPGMGKTTLALNIAVHQAIREEVAVRFYSMEMSAFELALKVISAESGIPLWILESGTMAEDQWEKLQKLVLALQSAPFEVADCSHLTIDQVEAECRSEPGLRVVFIDYLQLMTPPRAENRNLAWTVVSSRFKQLAREMGLTTCVLSQLSRDPEKRQDQRPILADLRESGAIEQDADAVLYPFREEEYNDDPALKGTAEIIVAKNRHGQKGSPKVAFEGDCSRFQPEKKVAPF
ncbi:MAG: replicative DNA helicase [Deltaproteobacteria bacterium]|nr:replicative DNA helicase [Deltaproteobacteria bacterium]